MEGKIPWNLDNRICVEAYAEAAEVCDSHYKVADLLNKRFYSTGSRSLDGKITSNIFVGATRRGTLKSALKRFVPEKAETLSSKFLLANKPKSTSKPKKAKRQQPVVVRRPPPPPAPVHEVNEASLSAILPDLKPLRFEDGTAATTERLNDSMCKFPIGDPGTKGFAYCGRGVVKGPYCADHARASYVPIRKRKAAARPDARSEELASLLRHR